MQLARMDVDGFSLNRNFSHDGQVPSRSFITTKCLHFDAATPFVANIYGPTHNIAEGFPVICDVRAYCRARQIRPHDLIETIPNNYNIAIRSEHYEELLERHTVAYDVDLGSDIVAVMLLNEISFGVAHGATQPIKIRDDVPTRRPIRHIEMQYDEEVYYGEWYEHYGLTSPVATDYAGENLSLEYHGPMRKPLDRIVSVPR
jgi:hypothetical protein